MDVSVNNRVMAIVPGPVGYHVRFGSVPFGER